MSFPMVAAICTEALLFVVVIGSIMYQWSSDLKKKRLEDPTSKVTLGDWCAWVILMLWLGFQFWKAWCVIRTLL